ncbi:MAG: endolytic transglycosylase MltG [Myxococcales bacterium]|nr:endolytic transglycosylase MltG [Myxococcales bacterium]MCB9519742.1 endolytic transglycosylase MltG [Myxococcales bacterium]MCB9530433.1 endolytic transglycosylase MltG [Myxococcales bacterium]MCB9533680.1 endolytic transglycosylase MltG [Myxococcales bacterium]
MLWSALVTTAMVALGGWLAWNAYGQWLEADVVIGNDPTEVDVAAGATARSVVRTLAERGVVGDDLGWEVLLRVERAGRCLQAGSHTVAGDATPRSLLATLCAPTRASSNRLTVPEGTNIYELADRLAARGLADRAEFLAAVDSAEAAGRFGIDAPSLEGYLFPDTYELPLDVTVEAIVRRMVERGRDVRADLAFDARQGSAASFGELELLTIASIVEEEAAVAEERPLIARVIYNRLDRGMRLQCDPTCVYGPELYRESATRERCRDEHSRYSTYVIDGLPPTPITNPGRAALEATLHPADAPDVLYFVARGDGTRTHAFATTLAEHSRNVERYLRGR